MKKKLMWLLIVAMIIGGVIMAHSKVYAVCENMCMEETYTKEEIDNIITDVNDTIYQKLNDLMHIVEISVTDIGSKQLMYPQGLNQNNTAIMTIMYSPSGNNYRSYLGDVDGTSAISVALSTNFIIVNNNIISSGKIKIILMNTDVEFI